MVIRVLCEDLQRKDLIVRCSKAVAYDIFHCLSIVCDSSPPENPFHGHNSVYDSTEYCLLCMLL